jgi:hypothetical protein
MAELRGEGLSQASIAGRLNDEGHTTRGSKPWGQVRVGRVLKRGGHRWWMNGVNSIYLGQTSDILGTKSPIYPMPWG